jgi:D-alanyl-lipoteichoic acid acyltransferase DltB (MBOAT superfamily)
MAYKPIFIFLLSYIVVINYFVSSKIESVSSRNKKKLFIFSLILNLVPLTLFKYLNFIVGNLNFITNVLDIKYSFRTFDILLPIGISFYTFKAISYSTEVYWGRLKAERNFKSLSLYIIFFPELLAGPIDRPQNLIPQFQIQNKFDYFRVKEGIKLLAWGLFQKMVIADRLSILVDKIYSTPSQYSGVLLIIATIFFAFQIYADFSGYSDIAIGSAKILGYNLMMNFNRPYFSKSVAEFWRRWHISLSTWFRDYIFLPMTYSMGRKISGFKNFKIKADVWAYCIGILVTMFLVGLWHGAGWNYVAWGSLIGIYMVISLLSRRFRKKIVKKIRLNKFPSLYKTFRVLVTFILITFTWIFFRANSLGDAIYIISHLASGFDKLLTIHTFLTEDFNINKIGLNFIDFFIAVAGICILIYIQLLQRKSSVSKLIADKPLMIKFALYLLFFACLFLFGNLSTSQFLYFRF